MFYFASNSSVLRARSAVLSIKVTCNNLTLSTAEQHMKTTLLCPTYSLQAAELIHGPDDKASVYVSLVPRLLLARAMRTLHFKRYDVTTWSWVNIVNLLLFRRAREKCGLGTKLAFYIVKMLTSHKKGKQAHVGMKPSKTNQTRWE